MRIEINELSKGYWLQPVLRGINLSLEPGRIMALVGSNGAGKSTLLRCLATLLVLDDGEIRFDGELLSRARVDLRRRLFFVTDSPAKVENVDVITHIAFILRAYGDPPPGIEETVAGLMAEFDMLDCQYKLLGQLSRGQTYKAALICLIALDRELWLLDEPFGSGMDPRGLAAFRRHARDAVLRGRTIIYTTQLIAMVKSFADCIGVLRAGGLETFASVDEIKAASGRNSGLYDEFTDTLPGEG